MIEKIHQLSERQARHLWDMAALQLRQSPTEPEDWDRLLMALRMAHDTGQNTQQHITWEPAPSNHRMHAGLTVKCVSGTAERRGIVEYTDRAGFIWSTENQLLGHRREDTWFIQAPTPVWHSLPAQRPGSITNVEHEDGTSCGHMIMDRNGTWTSVDPSVPETTWSTEEIRVCSLYHHRLVRDGVFEDGRARFREIPRDQG